MENISIEPLYVEIYNDIKSKIQTGESKSGDKLPTESELVSHYKASRGTVRKALDMLTKENVIEKIHGKGSYFTDKKISSPIAQRLVSIGENLKQQNLDYKIKILNKKILTANSEVKHKLDINNNEKVFYLERIIFVEGEPLILINNWVNLARVPEINSFDYNEIGLFKAIEMSIGRNIEYGIRTFKAVISDENTNKIFNFSTPNPLLFIDQVTYNELENPIEFSKIYIKDGIYQITSKLYR